MFETKAKQRTTVIHKGTGDGPIDISPAGRAARLRHRQFVEGAQIFATRYSTIHACAETGNISGLRHFLDKMKISVDIRDKAGNTPLILASGRGHWIIVDSLLGDGAATELTNVMSQTAAHAAVNGGFPGILRKLLDAGASVKSRDVTGATPAHYAAQKNNVACVEALYNCARIETRNSTEELPPYDHAVLETKMNNGMTPAHTAALFDAEEVLRFLHDIGSATLGCTDSMDETPMHKAARVQALRALTFLRTLFPLDGPRNCEGDTAEAIFTDNTFYWATTID